MARLRLVAESGESRVLLLAIGDETEDWLFSVKLSAVRLLRFFIWLPSIKVCSSMLLNVNALADPPGIMLLFTFGEEGPDELREDAFDDESGDDFLKVDLGLFFWIFIH